MWTFIQSTGDVLFPDGSLIAAGYSGAPRFRNEPSQQDRIDEGCIPAGVYTISAPVDSKFHGPYALPLTPDPSNEMFGRAGFLIHGDSVQDPGSASHGCIIVARFARERIWESADHILRVIANPVTIAA